MNKVLLVLCGCLLFFSFVYAENNTIVENTLTEKSVRQYSAQNFILLKYSKDENLPKQKYNPPKIHINS